MISFNFLDRLTINTFSRENNNYSYNAKILSDITVNSEKLVPLLFHSNNKFICNRENIEISNWEQFSGKTINKLKAKEICDSSKCPLRIKIKSKYYYLGKGFIATEKDYTIDTVLMLLTIPHIEYDNNLLSDINLIVNPAYEAESQVIKSIVKEYISENTGDIIVTQKIEKYINEIIVLPEFTTINGKKEYVDNLVSDIIEDYPF